MRQNSVKALSLSYWGGKAKQAYFRSARAAAAYLAVAIPRQGFLVPQLGVGLVVGLPVGEYRIKSFAAKGGLGGSLGS